MQSRFETIIQAAGNHARGRTLLVSGRHDPAALDAVLRARDEGWVAPLACGRAFSGMTGDMEVVRPEADMETARKEAFLRAHAGEAALVLDTGPLDPGFFSFLSGAGRARPGKETLSHVGILRAPKDGRLTLLTDPLVDHPSDIRVKIAVTENAIRAAKALGIEAPRIAVLSALELVNPAIPSTIEAAVLSKMSDRGQFGGAIIEGPLAMDNAESAAAAEHKGIHSPVPGDVDIYLFPDLESAQTTARFLTFLGRTPLAGVLMGTPFPVVIRSPLEPPESWLSNLAAALLL
jgi:hypothetical protein